MAKKPDKQDWSRILSASGQKKLAGEIERNVAERPPTSAPAPPSQALRVSAAPAPAAPDGRTFLWSGAAMSPPREARSAGGAGGLKPPEEAKAIAILTGRGRGGFLSGYAGHALGAAVVFCIAGAAFFGARHLVARGSSDPPDKLLAGIEPPAEDERRLLAATRSAPDVERNAADVPTFHVRPRDARAFDASAEWTELGGPTVDLDADPPRLGRGR